MLDEQDALYKVLPDSLLEASREAAGYGHSAPVRIPEREQLAVQLVPVSFLQRLEELRSDSTIFQGILWTVVGGLLGFLITASSSNSGLHNVGYLVALLSSFAIIFAFLVIRANKRVTTLKKKILNGASDGRKTS